MARPAKEGMDYFSHDTDAVNDPKIEVLRALYGNDGYAFFFILLEQIYKSSDFEVNVSDAEMQQIFARKVSVTPQKFSEMIQTAVKWGCFDREAYEKRGVLTSNGIKKRASVVLRKRKKMREEYREARDIKPSDDDRVSDRVSDAETQQKKGRNTAKTPKEKESKGKDKDIYISVINFLNQKAGTNYKAATKTTQQLIDARLSEGFTETDFITVIDKKTSEWKGTDMAKYLRPETLFGTKCESYLNQSTSGKSAGDNNHPEGFEVIR
ncbi:conserved phage C-terminal domain-containing protein [Desulfoscipio sp. XC116]|uniref:conserved phage C-terminal domain-containing protein n=1 Tax=Desulfoscipio sp. XC116 TaxID=3144975 RepID=UPI00325B1035